MTVLVPDAKHHDTLNSAIYDELVHGNVVDATRRRVVAITEELWDAGAGAILLGCTELELLIRQADIELPAIPCTTLHVERRDRQGSRPRPGRCSASAASSCRSPESACSGSVTGSPSATWNV